MLGGQVQRFAEAQNAGLLGSGRGLVAFGLVGDHHHRLVALAQDGGEDAVKRRHAFAGVDDEKGDVAFIDGFFGLLAHARFQRLVGQVLKAGGIDQFEVDVADAAGGVAAVTRDAGPVVDDGELLSGQAVEQGRFADIGPADYGNFQRHPRLIPKSSGMTIPLRQGFGGHVPRFTRSPGAIIRKKRRRIPPALSLSQLTFA